MADKPMSRLREFATSFRFAALAFVLVVLYPVIAETFGRVEGWLWPVVDDVVLVAGPDSERYFSRVSGSFVKLRNCEFAGIEWRLGDRDSSIVIDFEFLDPSQIRLEGRQAFGPWRVKASALEIESRVFAVVRHYCHPFYATITNFYP